MTRERIEKAYERAGYSVEETGKDPRCRILIDAADAYEQYLRHVRSIKDIAEGLQTGIAANGIGAVYDTVLQHSSIADIQTAAHKVNALRSVLAWMHHEKKDAVTDLIKAFVNRSPVERG